MSCIEIAYLKYQERKDIDTNPMIARTGAHWYYRSDQLIFNPKKTRDLRSDYVGPPEKAPKEFFGPGTWEEDKETLEYLLDIGLKDLGDLERLYTWLICNEDKMGGKFTIYKEFLENFCQSCQNPDIGDYWNFRRNIELYQFKDGNLLIDCFMTMYNTSKALLELRSTRIINPEWN